MVAVGAPGWFGDGPPDGDGGEVRGFCGGCRRGGWRVCAF